MKNLRSTIAELALEIVFFISFLSVAISLYYSEIEKVAPCTLCWWQRIFMYPIAIISFIALVQKKRDWSTYILGLAIPGFVVAVYHSLLQKTNLFGEEGIIPCAADVSCTTIDIEWFGFLTMPMASALAFLTVIVVTVLFAKAKR